MSLYIVKTPSGPVTSYRTLHSQTRDPVPQVREAPTVWRTDEDRPVHWPTRDEAWLWVVKVWQSDPDALLKAGWEVTEG